MDVDPAIAPHPPENSPENSPEAPPEEQFLQISLPGELPLLLPGANLVEIMKLAIGQVVPMFEMAPWVMGIYNWRGDMLWIADLGHFLGLTPWYNQAAAATRHTVVVIRPPFAATPLTDEPPPTLGLVVSAVEAMVTYPAARQPVPDPLALPLGLRPFVADCCPDAAGQPQPILEATALLAAMASSPSEPPVSSSPGLSVSP